MATPAGDDMAKLIVIGVHALEPTFNFRNRIENAQRARPLPHKLSNVRRRDLGRQPQRP